MQSSWPPVHLCPAPKASLSQIPDLQAQIPGSVSDHATSTPGHTNRRPLRGQRPSPREADFPLGSCVTQGTLPEGSCRLHYPGTAVLVEGSCLSQRAAFPEGRVVV